MESEKVTVQCDVTVALPLLATALDSTAKDAAAKRKRLDFDPSGRVLVVNGQPLADNRYQEP